MIEKEVFSELNVFGEGGALSADLVEDKPPPEPTPSVWSQVFGCCAREVQPLMQRHCTGLAPPVK